jgi:hypothetical protein
MYCEAAAYEGQRDVLTIATGEWFGRGRLQEASVFGRASPALKVDRAISGLGKIKQLSVNVSIRSGHQRKGPKAEVRGSFMKFIIFRPLSFFY